ncbi:MAG: DUF2680 domain-containing protein [Clostridiales bacterium]|nr:DUF2680 domain-containing protein [Clostridiales bacterium]
MMKKTLLIILAVVLLLVPVAVFAFGSASTAAPVARGYYGTAADEETLTPQQQADLEESFQQMIELRKETIGKMVENGLLTEEEGQRQLDLLDEMVAYHEETGEAGLYGIRGGCFGGLGAFDEDDYGRGGMMRYGGRRNWN